MTPEERAKEVVHRHVDRQRTRETWESDIAKAISFAVAEEREAAFKLAHGMSDDLGLGDQDCHKAEFGRKIAAAIRARSNQ